VPRPQDITTRLFSRVLKLFFRPSRMSGEDVQYRLVSATLRRSLEPLEFPELNCKGSFVPPRKPLAACRNYAGSALPAFGKPVPATAVRHTRDQLRKRRERSRCRLWHALRPSHGTRRRRQRNVHGNRTQRGCQACSAAGSATWLRLPVQHPVSRSA
jgi:hypothetical protein